MLLCSSLRIEFFAFNNLLHQFDVVLHLHYIDLVDFLHPIQQSVLDMFFNQGQGQSVIIVPACSANPVEVDIKINIDLLV